MRIKVERAVYKSAFDYTVQWLGDSKTSGLDGHLHPSMRLADWLSFRLYPLMTSQAQPGSDGE